MKSDVIILKIFPNSKIYIKFLKIKIKFALNDNHDSLRSKII